MGLFFSLQAFSLLTLLSLHAAMPYTVLMPDGGSPSTLIDAPQPGFIMNNGGVRTDKLEQEAVYDIMRATGNDWATQIPDVCRGRWHGIECMPDKDNVYHVVALSFGALSDDTAFPTCDQTRSFLSPSLTKLPHIRTLFFYQCFTNNPQPIPSFLGHLGPTLQTLVLRENGHVGPIPNELGNLTHLKVLDLHKNNLNGSIPVSLNRITNLRSLDLGNNRLSGSIPSLSFRVLNILDLSQNLQTGSIPPSLGSCHDLVKIDFSRNHLSGPIPTSIDGLCFNLENGFEDGSDLPYDSGIGYCGTPRPESGREVEHLSSTDEDVTKSVRASSALAHKPYNVFMMLLLLILC
ncbi:Leucine-rich repeat [Dillenia turbinata]|uniref:Leucine-rich repeat n=1 Tax=Dillenia turbinata TaxID=194707 RepID=A0AAN8US93_9MAGN